MIKEIVIVRYVIFVFMVIYEKLYSSRPLSVLVVERSPCINYRYLCSNPQNEKHHKFTAINDMITMKYMPHEPTLFIIYVKYMSR